MRVSNGYFCCMTVLDYSCHQWFVSMLKWPVMLNVTSSIRTPSWWYVIINWSQTTSNTSSNKPLPVPMMTQFTYAFMRLTRDPSELIKVKWHMYVTVTWVGIMTSGLFNADPYLTQCWLIFNGTFQTDFRDNRIKLKQFWYKKMNLKLSPAKWWPLCLIFHVWTNSRQKTTV